jgi:rod shape-determining protein MreC
LVLGVIALALILVGTYTPWLQPLRAQLAYLNTPIYWLTDLPGRFTNWIDERFSSKQALLEENEILKAELLIHQRKLQQMNSVYAQNLRLQQLMNTTEELAERVVVAELIGVPPDPLAHKVIINKGREDGVYINQPLLDADGLMGRVVEVGPYTSQVLLITDSMR